MLKWLAVLAVCAGLVLGRPSGVGQNEQMESNPIQTGPQDGSLKSLILAATTTKKPTTSVPWYEKLSDAVKIDFSSMGKIDNNPAEGGEIDGKLYHKLALAFGADKDYVLYLDHILNRFQSGEGGELGLGYHSPLPYVGDVSVRLAQNIDSTDNATFTWRLDLSDDAWKNYIFGS